MGMHKSGRNDTTTPGASCKLDKATPVRYLREYIEQMQAGLLPKAPTNQTKKKLTFEEWWKNNYSQLDKSSTLVEAYEMVWNAAQENV